MILFVFQKYKEEVTNEAITFKKAAKMIILAMKFRANAAKQVE